MRTTFKRFWIVAAAFTLVGALGACADEPMGVEEAYEVQMDGNSGGGENCVWIGGQLHCRD